MDTAMDMREALRLQLEWGADEALADLPVDRLARRLARPQSAGPQSAPLQPPSAQPAAPQPPATRAPATRPAASPAPLLPGAAAIQRARDLAAACATLDALRAALTTFDGCPLSATATSLVFNDGNPAAGLMIIGEAPGAEEDRSGTPFVGPPGQLLDRILASIGLDRTRCLLTNTVFWRPPGNRAPTDAEVQVCLPFLHRQIALVRPRHLVLLGAPATKAITGTTAGITRMRGKWLAAQVPGLDSPVPTLPTVHPSHLLLTPASRRVAWDDWRLLRRTLDSS